VKSRVDSRSVQLRVNQAIEVGNLGAGLVDAASVTLNDVTKGGSGRIVAGKESNRAAKFSAQQTIDQTIQEQAPEPAPPPPP
jgi:hypothetical protein